MTKLKNDYDWAKTYEGLKNIMSIYLIKKLGEEVADDIVFELKTTDTFWSSAYEECIVDEFILVKSNYEKLWNYDQTINSLSDSIYECLEAMLESIKGFYKVPWNFSPEGGNSAKELHENFKGYCIRDDHKIIDSDVISMVKKVFFEV